MRGNVIPVEITIYEDRSFSFVTKTPPAAELIKKAAGVAKGSPTPHTTKVAKLTKAQVREIAETKQPDLNANDIEQAAKIIEGTARSMISCAVARVRLRYALKDTMIMTTAMTASRMRQARGVESQRPRNRAP